MADRKERGFDSLHLRLSHARLIVTAMFVLCITAQATLSRAAPPYPSQRVAAPFQGRVPAAHRSLKSYGNFPLAFEVNRGQTDRAVRFLARAQGYLVFLTGSGAVLSQSGSSGTAIELRPLGSNKGAKIVGLSQLVGKVNYLLGTDRRRWQRDIPTYAEVAYRNLYQGVDLVFHGASTGNRTSLEYDWRVAAGADISAIRLQVRGPVGVVTAGDGGLLLARGHNILLQARPTIYQQLNGKRVMVAGRYRLLGQNVIGFTVGKHNRSKPLIIDPVVRYATYLGGKGNEQGNGIAVDGQGNAYVVGQTLSPDFPVKNAYQSKHGTIPCRSPYTGQIVDCNDVLVTKLNPAGNGIVYSTFIGGRADDYGNAIAVDARGNAYVTGLSTSDFPVSSNAFQRRYAGGQEDAFITKLNPAGDGLAYSTYVGGKGRDEANGIAVDKSGNAVIVGLTTSTDLPLAAAAQGGAGGGEDAFVSKLSADGSHLLYSTYLAGNGNDGTHAVAVDAAGNAYVTGATDSTNFPTIHALQASSPGAQHAFVTKLSSAGQMVYSTYLGGGTTEGFTIGFGIAVDGTGDAYVTGQTAFSAFPVSSGAFQTIPGGLDDAFVTELNPGGNGLVYSTFLGGSASDTGTGIALDRSGDAYVTGFTTSVNFPSLDQAPGMRGLLTDAVVTEIRPGGKTLAYSTYIGGTSDDLGNAIAVSPSGDAYVTGLTTSLDLHTTNAIQTKLAGGKGVDAFVVSLVGAASPTTPPPLKVQVGEKRVQSGGELKLGITTAPNAKVTVTLQVREKGRVVFQEKKKGKANNRGEYKGKLKITYKPKKPVEGRLTITSKTKGGETKRTAKVTILPEGVKP